MMSSLDKFLEKQYIGFDQYLRYAPKTVVPFKDRLLKEMEQREEMMAQQVLSEGNGYVKKHKIIFGERRN